jgi:protein CMS1
MLTSFTEAMLLDTTRFTTERSVDALAPFVRHVLPSLSKLLSGLQAPLASGSPSLLVVTGNAQRAADLSRGLRPLLPRLPEEEEGSARKKRRTEEGEEEKEKEGEKPRLHVGKLFARHFKVRFSQTRVRSVKRNAC